jgi:MFS family permease
VMIGLTTFLPVFVQGVMQKSPLVGGFALSAMVLGWPIGSTIGIRAGFRRFGVRAVLRSGAVLMPLGALAFLILNQESSPLVAGLGSFVVGLGMGASSASSIILIQEIVGWSERGSVTASYLFARSLGSTFGRRCSAPCLTSGFCAPVMPASRRISSGSSWSAVPKRQAIRGFAPRSRGRFT